MKKNIYRMSLLFFVLIYTFAVFPFMAYAAPAEVNNVPVGNSKFVNLSTYMTSTDIKDVYKVTLSVEYPMELPNLTDIVMVVNSGQTVTRTLELVNYANVPVGTGLFGFVLDSNGQPTTTERRTGPGNTYSVWDAIVYSTEQTIRKLFDSTSNPNYEYTRVGLIAAKGNGGFDSAENYSGLVDYHNLDYLLGKLGDMESVPAGGTQVPYSKQIQNAYQFLLPTSDTLYYNFSAPTAPTVSANDLNAPLPNGNQINGSLTNGMWTPLIPNYNQVDRYIIAMHSIGANGLNGAGNYPINGAYSATDPLIQYNGGLSLNNPPANIAGATLYDVDGGAGTDYQVPYNIHRYNIVEISNRLKNGSGNKVFHNFTLWLDPAGVNPNGFVNGWLNFNDSISKFPIDGTPVPGSGYKLQADRSYAIRPVSGSYEWWEGVQYWNDAGYHHNILDFPEIDQNISTFINQIQPVQKEGIVKSKLSNGFTFYKYKSEPFFTSLPAISSVKNTSQELEWDISQLSLNDLNVALTFYVKFDASIAQEGISYPLMEYSYLTYKRRGILGLGELESDIFSVIKYFPEVFLTLGNGIATDSNIINPSNETTINSTEESTVNNGNSIDINIYGGPSKIVDDVVDEETEEVPITGESHVALLLSIVVLGISGIIIYKKNHRSH